MRKSWNFFHPQFCMNTAMTLERCVFQTWQRRTCWRRGWLRCATGCSMPSLSTESASRIYTRYATRSTCWWRPTCTATSESYAHHCSSFSHLVGSGRLGQAFFLMNWITNPPTRFNQPRRKISFAFWRFFYFLILNHLIFFQSLLIKSFPTHLKKKKISRLTDPKYFQPKMFVIQVIKKCSPW